MIFKLYWIKGRGVGNTTTITDLGAGYKLPLAHVAQQFPLKTIVRIESCYLQLLGYVSPMKDLLSSNIELVGKHKLLSYHQVPMADSRSWLY